MDELSWRADRDVQVDLPFHADGELVGVGSWASANPNGGSGVEDGFRFLADTETATVSGDVRLRARLGAATADARFIVDAASAWWRATAFGPPGSGRRRFYFVRTTGAHGRVVTVWDVHGAVESIAGRKRGVTVYMRDGSRHDHLRGDRSWRVAIVTAGDTKTVDLGGGARTRPGRRRAHRRRSCTAGDPEAHAAPDSLEPTDSSPVRVELPPLRALRGPTRERPVRRSRCGPMGTSSSCIVDVEKRDLYFAPQIDSNRARQRESRHEQRRSSVACDRSGCPPGRRRPHELNWLLVPELGGNHVRVSVRAVGGVAPPLHASWDRTTHGYSVRIAVDLSALPADVTESLKLGVVVNEMTSDRERRRGQLVLGGRPGGIRLPPWRPPRRRRPSRFSHCR